MNKSDIPDYQYFLKPLLEVAKDGNIYKTGVLLKATAIKCGFENVINTIKLPSGNSVVLDRIHWAKTFLIKAGLLEFVERGTLRITQRGKEALSSGQNIDVHYLAQFEEFNVFKKRTRREGSETVIENSAETVKDDKTPEELIAHGSEKLDELLKDEISERLKNCSPQFFEELVIKLLLALGYGGSQIDAAEALGKSGDGGVDGVIKEDKLGLDVVYVQAKRWEGTVGRPVVQAFAGSLQGFRANKGVMITTSQYSQDAVNYAKSIHTKIILIDGEKLAELMIENNVGVYTKAKYEIKKIDEDFFDEEY